MQKLYKVTLTPAERIELKILVSTGNSNAAKIKHANILLAVDENEHGRVFLAMLPNNFIAMPIPLPIFANDSLKTVSKPHSNEKNDSLRLANPFSMDTPKLI